MRSPSARGWLALTGAILFEVMAALSMKGALKFPGLFAVVVGGYLISFYCLSLVLRAGMSLGVAYGIWGAAGVVLTACGSALIFGEPLTATMALGMLLTVLGVLCIRMGTASSPREAL